MANEAQWPIDLGPKWAPVQFISSNMVSGARQGLSFASPIPALVVAMDFAFVGAISSGYIQVYSTASGGSIYVTQPNGLETAYASWRGMYFVAPGDDLVVFNNTAGTFGVSVSGFSWMGQAIENNFIPTAPT